MSQEKKELSPLETLNEDLFTLISSYLDKTDEPQELKSSRRKEFPFFRSSLMQKNRILAKLAQYAAEGNVKRIVALLIIRPDLRVQVLFTLAGLAAQDEMETILKQHPEDLLVKAPLRDISGRVFESISIFQHAIWAKDVRYMAKMMLNCLPQNPQGEQIRLKLLEQYKELRDKGVVYQLKGVRHENERHFSLDSLIEVLCNYKKEFYNLRYNERQTYWSTIIGSPQALTPAHIRHHYCDSQNLFSKTSSIEAPQLKRSLELHNFELNKRQLWTENLVELGKTLGICSMTYGSAPAYALSVYGVTEPPELPEIETLRALDEHRTKIDLPALIEQLQTPIQNLEKYSGIETCP
ncbi:hypothetical protein [Legionella clemsonensis]|uniref:Uncharacterized protein n=1 Tax=Legionella clemsonensis TaxID=1867846 RepID=A0A222P6H2_9GAMM|nr:hypothetical protein [Legionella clemsonensis]ASQ47397.1 hypothetical protein clem_14355 [Legionella clemsonensis]